MEYTNPKSITQFKRMLKTLENSGTMNLPQLRQLRQEQEYLIKLKDQRQKIENLKSKFDDKDKEIKRLTSQNTSLKKQLESVVGKYSRIEIKYYEEQEKNKQLEAGLKGVEYERERVKGRIMELEGEREELRRVVKNKEFALGDVEEEWKRKFKEAKESFMSEKRKMMDFHESQLKELSDSKVDKQEISQLQNLIERQNRALKLQEQSLIQLNNKTIHLQNEIQSIRDVYERTLCQNNELVGEVEFYKNEAQMISKKLKMIEEEEASKRELEYLKLRMNEMRRGEIESLENLVNQIRN